MPTIEFIGNGFRAAKRVEAADGGALVDICDEHLAPVPFSCRSASCGTCHVEVLEGAELFELPEQAEQELLDLIGGRGTSRLACQARLRSGSGLIRLRAHLSR